MWNLKCTIVPVIIGATGIVTRSLKKNLETIPGKHSIDSLQKTAILGTSHVIRKVLQCEAWSLSGGDHRWFKRSTGKKCLWQEIYILYNNDNNNRDITNVEPEMHHYTSNNWSHWNSNEKLKETFGNCTRKTLDRFSTKDGCTWNITHNTESTAVWSLKTDWWGSPLVQEKYQAEKACDEIYPYRIIIIIIPIKLHSWRM